MSPARKTDPLIHGQFQPAQWQQFKEWKKGPDTNLPARLKSKRAAIVASTLSMNW